MKCRCLHVFNPEHDFALAVGNGPYTPPGEVVKLKRHYALLPAYYAGNGDFILLPSELSDEEIKSSPFFNLVAEKNIILLKKEEIPFFSEKISKVLPWGWDHAIVNLLKDNGLPNHLLLSEDSIKNLRNLSHRRSIIPFRKTISSLLGDPQKYKAVELFNHDELDSFLYEFPKAFFKAPWSSSGRGIVVSDHISPKGLKEWAHGIFRRQGSIIAEPSWDKKIDFATEWIIRKSQPEFVGYSVFEASSRGKYHGNIKATQQNLLNIIKETAKGFHPGIIEAQREALRLHVAPFYEGPLGIDMLADTEGCINYCVEINLRMTMGLIEILKEKPSLLNISSTNI